MGPSFPKPSSPEEVHSTSRVLFARCTMSPTVFRQAGFRFYFFSREEPRLHVHVRHAKGEAKFWLEPHVGLARNRGPNDRDLVQALRLIQEHEHEIREAWKRHFGG